MPWDSVWPIVYSPAHLWFLEYLIVIATFVAGFSFLLNKLSSSSVQKYFDAAILRIFSGWWYMPGLVLLTGSLLLWSKATIFMPMSALYFEIHPASAIYYLLFFLVGWAFHKQPGHLDKLNEFGLPLLLSGVLIRILTVTVWWDPGIQTTLSGFSIDAISALLTSLYIWLFVFGFIGCFSRYSPGDSKVSRYISDSTYWCYIIHMVPCNLYPVFTIKFAHTSIGRLRINLLRHSTVLYDYVSILCALHIYRKSTKWTQGEV